VRLITNNPEKMRQLTQHRIQVAGRIPHVIPANEYNRFYLQTKGDKSGHLDIAAAARLGEGEQSDPVRVAGMPEDELGER
jgi:GTP cyclohydrolase II